MIYECHAKLLDIITTALQQKLAMAKDKPLFFCDHCQKNVSKATFYRHQAAFGKRPKNNSGKQFQCII